MRIKEENSNRQEKIEGEMEREGRLKEIRMKKVW